MPWRFPITVAEIPEAGRHFELVADEPTRAAIARLAGVEGISALSASFDVARYRREGLFVTGTIVAQVDQICVVTLEPIRSAITEPLDLTFAPQAGEARRVDVPIDEEGPELLFDGTLDLGTLAAEYLLLAIDPYPRKPGVVFESPAVPPDPSEHPFAALAALKRGKAGDAQ
jgi:uncharacterized metal-binding protein YceD (DUF177 family)